MVFASDIASQASCCDGRVSLKSLADSILFFGEIEIS